MATTINTKYQKDEMAIRIHTTHARLAGLTALGGGIIMLIGAVLYFSSGTDLWAAVDGGDMAGLIGLLSLVVLYIPPLSDLGFLIVPVGIGWMLATGIVLLRRGAGR